MLLSAPEDPPNPTLQAILAMSRDVIVGRAFGGRIDDAEHVKASFDRHNAAVKAALPANRLLVFDVAQGWEPLCAFLEVPVPTTPFPHMNSTKEFWEIVQKAGG
jgi:hypothetical protein